MLNEQPPDYDENSRLVRAFSFGGGVQSHAVLALQAMGMLLEPYDVFLFSNVGHDSENPDTLKFLNEHTIPFCEKHGIPFIELRRNIRGRGEVTLVEEIFYQQRSIVIPAYFGQGGHARRNCTTDFKVRVIDRYIRDQGYTHAVVGLGISTDEFTRARSTNWYHYEGQDYDSDPEAPTQTAFEGMELEPVAEKPKRNIGFWKQREYPLLNMRVDRASCKGIIEQSGLSMPGRSSCFFCPFTHPEEWVLLDRNHPELVEQSVKIEAVTNAKGLHRAEGGMYLHQAKQPLLEAIAAPVSISMFANESCDSGHCHT